MLGRKPLEASEFCADFGNPPFSTMDCSSNMLKDTVTDYPSVWFILQRDEMSAAVQIHERARRLVSLA